jgi:two-component system, OmpR family, sensor kinase
VSLPGGIRAKLAVALLVIVGGALATAYAIVIPTLRDNLVDAKIEQLERDAAPNATSLPPSTFWPEWVQTLAFNLDARVVIYYVWSQTPVTLGVSQDSRETFSRDVAQDPIAERAAQIQRTARGKVERGDHRYAEVAFPLGQSGPIVLVSAPLDDQEASIDFVKRRLLAAAIVALAVALVLGLIAATLHARRIRRLERAAERIAAGRFDEPVVDRGADELGELAQAFDRMRVQLAQLDTARKEFIANASHELRTPLFSLGGFLELMTDEDLDERTRAEFLETMREQVERLTKLATDLLDLSRVDAGRLRVEREHVELADTARTLVDELRGLAETRDHPLELDVDGEPMALGDEERVLQIGRALAGNALTHTPAGTRVVVRVAQNDGRAVLAVEDDGPGISGEHVERVFERFYRVEGGLASGSGLGLAIARELAELMGGRVILDSRPGRTVFALELDAAAERAPAPLEPALV